MELELEVDVEDASDFGLRIQKGEQKGEETVLIYEAEASLFTLDRNKSKGEGGTRSVRIDHCVFTFLSIVLREFFQVRIQPKLFFSRQGRRR